MILELSTTDPPIIGVVVPSQKTFSVVVSSPPVVNMTGFIGMPGPPGADGTIVHVGPTPPLDPSINDLWVDTT